MDEARHRRGRRAKARPDTSALPLPEGEKPTLRTIARLTGLAATTVSRAGVHLRASTSEVPDLPGTVVHATLSDMGGGMMGGRRAPRGGVMGMRADASAVPAGTVSIVAANLGTEAHELVVLAPGQDAGARAVRADGTVDETGSLGEASRSDGAGAGEGIEPGTSGWVSMNLAPGRYELVCNVAVHYAAGMYAELTVT